MNQIIKDLEDLIVLRQIDMLNLIDAMQSSSDVATIGREARCWGIGSVLGDIADIIHKHKGEV